MLRAESWLGEHRVDGGVDVVTLPCAEPLAYAIPGPPDQIAVTEGLASVLDEDELSAVVRHERSHLRWRHHRVLALGGDIEARFGWFGPARRSVGALRLAVERWADEDAGVGSAQARPAVRRALVKSVALAIGPVAVGTEASPRTVEVEMVDNAFEPAEVAVAAGETVRFVFRNTGAVGHDAVIGDEAAQEEHEEEMRAAGETTTSEGEMGGMDHGPSTEAGDDEAAITVEPGEKGEITHTFHSAGEQLIGGHYAAGMKVAIDVARR